MSKPTLDELVEATEKILDTCYGDITLQSEPSKQQAAILAIYINMLEISEATLESIKVRRRICTATLLRSLMEYFVDFLFVLEAPSNVDKLLTISEVEQKKLVNNLFDCKHEDFAETTNTPEFEQRRSELNSSLKDEKPLSIYQRFDQVGMAERFYPQYRMLSSLAHLNLAQQCDTHFNKSAEGTWVFSPKLTMCDDETEINICTLASFLESSVKKVHEFFSGKIPADINNKLDGPMNVLRRNMQSDNTPTNNS